MALRVGSALLLAILLGGCNDPNSPFSGFSSLAPSSSTQPGRYSTLTVPARVRQLRSDQAALASAITRLQGQLEAVRLQIANEAGAYAGLVNSVASQLQPGTTPGNPNLLAQWNSAQSRLDAIVVNVGKLNTLAIQVTTEATVAGYLIESERAAFAIAGATEEDHRNLHDLANQTAQSMQQIDTLIGALNAEIGQQNAFLARERLNLAALAYGVSVGRLDAPGGAPQVVGGSGRRRVVVPLQ